MSIEYHKSSLRHSLQNLHFTFSTFHDKHSLIHLSQICTHKLKEIKAKTYELINDTEDKKKRIAINERSKDDEKKRRLSFVSLSKNHSRENPNDDLVFKMKQLSQKQTNGSNSIDQSIKLKLRKNKTLNDFHSDIYPNPFKTGHSFFVTSKCANKSKTKNNSNSNSNNTNESSLLNSPLALNRNTVNTSLLYRCKNQLQYSNSCKTLTSPMKARYQFISDTLTKSVKESDRFNRNLNFYMNEQRMNRVSKSFPKKDKSKKELELEGRYEELTEKMKATSQSFKEHYISYKNKRTGNFHIIRSGYADLMSYIDNYSKMEDGLFFRYKDRVKKMYPIIQGHADLNVMFDGRMLSEIKKPNETKGKENEQQQLDDSFSKINSNTNMKLFNETDISPSTKKIRDLTHSLQRKKNRLMNRLNENIKSNCQYE